MKHEGCNEVHNMTNKTPEFECLRKAQKDDKVCTIKIRSNCELPVSSCIPVDNTVHTSKSLSGPATFSNCGFPLSKTALSQTTSSHSYFNTQTGTSIVHVTSPNRSASQTFRENSIYIERQWEMLKGKMMHSNKIDPKHFMRNNDNYDEQKYDLDFKFIDESSTNEVDDAEHKNSLFNRSTSNLHSDSNTNKPLCLRSSPAAVGITSSVSFDGFLHNSVHQKTKHGKLNGQLVPNSMDHSLITDCKKSSCSSQGLLGVSTKSIISFKNTLSFCNTGIVSSTSSPVSSASFFSAATGANRISNEKPLFIRSFKEEFLSGTNLTQQSLLLAHEGNKASISSLPILVSPKYANLCFTEAKKSTLAAENVSNKEALECVSRETVCTSLITAPLQSADVYSSSSTTTENKNTTAQDQSETHDTENVVSTSSSPSSKVADSVLKSIKYQEMLSRKTLKKKQKKELVLTAEKVPDYKGDASLDDIINFINNEGKTVNNQERVKVTKKSKKKVNKERANPKLCDQNITSSSELISPSIITISSQASLCNVVDVKSLYQTTIASSASQHKSINVIEVLPKITAVESGEVNTPVNSLHACQTDENAETKNKIDNNIMKYNPKKLTKTSSLDCDKNIANTINDDYNSSHISGLDLSEGHLTDDNTMGDNFSVVFKKKKRTKHKMTQEAFNKSFNISDIKCKEPIKNKRSTNSHIKEPKLVPTAVTLASSLKSNDITRSRVMEKASTSITSSAPFDKATLCSTTDHDMEDSKQIKSLDVNKDVKLGNEGLSEISNTKINLPLANTTADASLPNIHENNMSSNTEATSSCSTTCRAVSVNDFVTSSVTTFDVAAAATSDMKPSVSDIKNNSSETDGQLNVVTTSKAILNTSNYSSMCKSLSIPDKVSNSMNIFLDTRLTNKPQLASSLDIQFGFDDGVDKLDDKTSRQQPTNLTICDNQAISLCSIVDVQFIDRTDLKTGDTVLEKINECVQFVNKHSPENASDESQKLKNSNSAKAASFDKESFESTKSDKANCNPSVPNDEIRLGNNDDNLIPDNNVVLHPNVKGLDSLSSELSVKGSVSNSDVFDNISKVNTSVTYNSSYQTDFSHPVGIIINDSNVTMTVANDLANLDMTPTISTDLHSKQLSNKQENYQNNIDAQKFTNKTTSNSNFFCTNSKEFENKKVILKDHHNRSKTRDCKTRDRNVKFNNLEAYHTSDTKQVFRKASSTFDFRRTQIYLNAGRFSYFFSF
ncbi:hypothetical protein HELRODRAFT_168128 [Helobdella robusta]|uniref:Uncharacterized protein n=1 Tax=Helobdella robusta TaxID=6412 RepID=T1F072_HELRO|nr:hypothetical protein HELRODRAFT_168128 [Helobdella robusta]ESO10240.1 hypothetical protein HELRODRAFT_168128 [Helobdella robusta]